MPGGGAQGEAQAGGGGGAGGGGPAAVHRGDGGAEAGGGIQARGRRAAEHGQEEAPRRGRASSRRRIQPIRRQRFHQSSRRHGPQQQPCSPADSPWLTSLGPCSWCSQYRIRSIIVIVTFGVAVESRQAQCRPTRPLFLHPQRVAMGPQPGRPRVPRAQTRAWAWAWAWSLAWTRAWAAAPPSVSTPRAWAARGGAWVRPCIQPWSGSRVRTRARGLPTAGKAQPGEWIRAWVRAGTRPARGPCRPCITRG